MVSSYKNLPASKFARNLLLYLPHPCRTKKPIPAINLPAWTKPDPEGIKGVVRNIETTRKIIAELKARANTLPANAGYSLWNTPDDLNGLLIRGWTEVDEALTCINQGMYYLHRWQSRNGRIGDIG